MICYLYIVNLSMSMTYSSIQARICEVDENLWLVN